MDRHKTRHQMKDRLQNEETARLPKIRSTLQETKLQQYGFDQTLQDWSRTDGNFIYLDGKKVFDDLPKDIKKSRSANVIERFFDHLLKNKNVNPAIVDYLKRYSHQNGYMKASESNTSQYFALKGMKIVSHKNRYDYIINHDGFITFIERFYIDEYINFKNIETTIKPEEKGRPIALGVTVSTIRLDQNEIKHELAFDKILLIDKKMSSQLFMRNRVLFWCHQKYWQWSGLDMNEFPYVLFDDKETILHEKYDESLSDIEAGLNHDFLIAKNKGVPALAESFRKKSWMDKINHWVDKHPWLTIFIILLVITLLASAITAAIVFSTGTAAIPALLALKVGKIITVGALTGVAAKVLGILGIGALLGVMAAAGAWIGSMLENAYVNYFENKGSEQSGGEDQVSGTDSDDAEILMRERASLYDMKQQEFMSSDWKSIANRQAAELSLPSNMTAAHFVENDRNATNEADDFIKQNIDFFKEPFEAQHQFSQWVKKGKMKQMILLKYLTTLLNPLNQSSLVLRDAILVNEKMKDGLVHGNEELMRSILDTDPKLRTELLKNKNGIQQLIDHWKKTYQTKSRNKVTAL